MAVGLGTKGPFQGVGWPRASQSLLIGKWYEGILNDLFHERIVKNIYILYHIVYTTCLEHIYTTCLEHCLGTGSSNRSPILCESFSEHLREQDRDSANTELFKYVQPGPSLWSFIHWTKLWHKHAKLDRKTCEASTLHRTTGNWGTLGRGDVVLPWVRHTNYTVLNRKPWKHAYK